MEQGEQVAKGAVLLKNEEEKASPKVLGALTLVLFEDLSCDALAETVVDGKSFKANLQLFGIFRSFLEDVCQEMNVSQVLRKYVAK